MRLFIYTKNLNTAFQIAKAIQHDPPNIISTVAKIINATAPITSQLNKPPIMFPTILIICCPPHVCHRYRINLNLFERRAY